MGIQVEFNPDLALRNLAEYKAGRREKAECIPSPLKKGRRYPFLKLGQRNYWLMGEIPLLETTGEQRLSRPVASIKIIEAQHFLKHGRLYTKGIYKVLEVITDNTIHFESYKKL